MASNENSSSADSKMETEVQSTSQFVGFQVADQEYAFQIEQIQEIVIGRQVTRLPQVSDYVEGVCNLRGTIIPLINLRLLFGIERKPVDDSTRIIVVNVGARVMGCIVDSVSQVLKIPTESIQPAPSLVAPSACAYVKGFAKLDERIIILLEIDNLLDPEKLDAVHQAATEEIAKEPDN